MLLCLTVCLHPTSTTPPITKHLGLAHSVQGHQVDTPPVLTPYTDLSIASFHVSQRHLWVDGVTAGNTEDLKICVITITFSHLQRDRQVRGRDRQIKVRQRDKSDRDRQVRQRDRQVSQRQTGRSLTSSCCWTCCSLALAMMPSSS